MRRPGGALPIFRVAFGLACGGPGGALFFFLVFGRDRGGAQLALKIGRGFSIVSSSLRCSSVSSSTIANSAMRWQARLWRPRSSRSRRCASVMVGIILCEGTGDPPSQKDHVTGYFIGRSSQIQDQHAPGQFGRSQLATILSRRFFDMAATAQALKSVRIVGVLARLPL